MKKIIVVLLSMCLLISFVGCDNNADNTVNNDDTILDQLKDNDKNEVTYTAEQILFVANDRCDIEDDRSTLYAYNYKGERINTDEVMAYFSYYSENGLAPAYDQNSGKVGFVDKNGVFQIEPKYDDAAPFSHDGIALVMTEQSIGEGENYKYIRKYGYINSKGEEIIPLIYDYATSFLNCGYALARTEKEVIDEEGYTYTTTDKQYILDKKGNVVVEFDVEAENRGIDAVFDGYYVCKYFDDSDCYSAIFSFSGDKLDEIANPRSSNNYSIYDTRSDYIYKYTYETLTGEDEGANKLVEIQKFNGKKFIDIESDVEFTSKRVATTKTGFGYGLEKNGEIIIPFEYDRIVSYGGYYLAIQYTGYDFNFDQIIDIYDKDYNKTADNIPYAFYEYRYEAYGERCKLPEGYFPIIVENDDYNDVHGIIDYSGNIIMEPVFGRGITLYSYEGMGYFSWRAEP